MAKKLSRKQALLLTGAGVLVLALAGGGTALALNVNRSPALETQQAAAAQPFDLNASNAASRPRLEQVPEAVAQLKASGFTPAVPGKLTVATAVAAPPLTFLAADDNTTVLGVEADQAQLVADGLGLELNLVTVSWADWPLGLQSGKYDIVSSNVTVTDERKKLFDFASTREDLLGFLVAKDSKLESIKEATDVSGLKLSVSSGTNQEKVLLQWNKELKAAGKEPAELVYYDDFAAASLAISSGRIDGFLSPNPTAQYQVQSTGQFKVVGTIQGGWPATAPIAIGTAKGNGLIKPVNTVVNAAIKQGSYGKLLTRWGLGAEALKRSTINPEGIPATVG
ncbi:ABC transporter substrate-binding protein [Galactobacter caseinivorans]|uniref:ABC transporter substrate-binding protein n=1 Tax=Galactobacter caseinivorans TaxID=2676123 RepID=A0A496PMS3_9MICC|nr:ABC transporter substrate-binding protein [Galactobacter caseinivorans]RKW71831.1 ABC transporter substrate-binding protein [Galactobacter caseinivorans]